MGGRLSRRPHAHYTHAKKRTAMNSVKLQLVRPSLLYIAVASAFEFALTFPYGMHLDWSHDEAFNLWITSGFALFSLALAAFGLRFVLGIVMHAWGVASPIVERNELT